MQTTNNFDEQAYHDAVGYLDHLDTTYADVVYAVKRSATMNLGINDFTGQGYLTNKEALLNAVKIIREELNELEKGILEDNQKEILDGAVDVGITWYNVIAKLIHSGYDVASAINETDDNNLTKFVTDVETAQQSVEMYAEKGIKMFSIFHSPTGRYVLLDENQKYRKPVSYVSNDLTKYTPEGKEQLNAE